MKKINLLIAVKQIRIIYTFYMYPQKDLKKQNQLKLEYSNPDYEKAKKVIEDININNINPVQALVKLNEIIDIIKSSKN